MKYSSMRGRVLMSLLALVMMIPMGAPAQSDAPFGVQVIRQPALLMAEDGVTVIGFAEYWNTRNNFIVEFELNEALENDGWRFGDMQVYAGEEPPTLKKDSLVPGKFPCKRDFQEKKASGMVSCFLSEEFEHTWGGDQTRFISLHGDLVMLDELGVVVEELGFYGMPINEAATESDVYENGSVFTTKFAHPRKGHFIDSPVGGLTYETPTNWGVTEDSGGFDYFPGEEVELWVGTVFLGKALAGQKISPLDIFLSENVDTDEALQDTRVVNMARLLQSLDFDGEPKGGIGITPTVRGCLDMAAENLGLLDFTTGESIVNFADSNAVQMLIDETLVQCAGAPNVSLVEVSAAEAAANLEAGLNASGIFRKNVSK